MTEFSVVDATFMARALTLAELGRFTAHPNPCVGCVIAKDGRSVGEGWHERAGEPHAEVWALRAAGSAARGATLYVTLEPCSHHGRTPPCVDAILAAGVSRVVVAVGDPNPLVAGNGLAKLESAGVQVEVGLLSDAALRLNRAFFKRMLQRVPFVVAKSACSLDGRTALANGHSQWITGADARRDVHRLRAESDAILTGVGTILADDPQLIARVEFACVQPRRAIVDSRLRTPPTAKVVGAGTLIFCISPTENEVKSLQSKGAEVVVLPPDRDARVPLDRVLEDLGRRGCNQVLIEAGSRLTGSALHAGLVDEFVLYLAPSLLGDQARGLATVPELHSMQQRLTMEFLELRRVGQDIRMTLRPTCGTG